MWCGFLQPSFIVSFNMLTTDSDQRDEDVAKRLEKFHDDAEEQFQATCSSLRP